MLPIEVAGKYADGEKSPSLLRPLALARFARRGLVRWLGLTSASLICVAFAFFHGGASVGVMMAIALASLLSSIAGFAFSAICGAILFHLSGEPIQVVQIMITCSIANQVAMTWALRRDIDWSGLTLALVGGALGLPIGVWVLLHADRSQYTSLLGAFLIVYGGYMLVRRPIVWRRQHPILDLGTGLLGGVSGGAAGFPGAFVTIWCGMKGWDKVRQRALFQPYILIMQIAGLLTISVARSSGGNIGFDPADLLCIPLSLMGTACGLTFYRRLSDQQFARAVNVLLIVSGVSYIV